MSRKIIWLPLVAALATAVAAPVAGAADRALPAFTVVSAEGQPRAAAELTTETRWLLVYVAPESPPCNRLLRLLGEWQSAPLVSRTVVVVRGSVDDARAYVEKRLPPQLLGHVTWYADPDGSAWEALDLHGTPVMVGVENGAIEWRLAGVLSRPESLESVVRTWVEKQ